MSEEYFDGKPLVTHHNFDFWWSVRNQLLRMKRSHFYERGGWRYEIKFLFGKAYCEKLTELKQHRKG